MAARSQSFLNLLARGVFGQSQSPYRALFDAAGIDFLAVERLTRDHGVDGALERLYESGVWLKLEEFKGRRPIERSGLRLDVRAEDFDNPLVRPQFEGRTGGSRGTGRRLLLDLDLLTHDAACHYLHLQSFDFIDGPMAMWRPVPPDNSGVKKALMNARMGGRLDRWFTQSPIRAGGGQFKFFLFTWHTLAGFRFYGGERLVPEYTPIAQAGKVARWLAQQRERGRPAYLDTLASAAVRVCKAAAQSGLDIRGTLFRVGGEPLTPGKVRVIQESGCRVICHYSHV
uniref:Uncharacterized protein n=1 Tax=uncultured bacterium 89 TaxID=698393 RepID=E3T688_9BACT|nr:hypothetical protein [uncultured bacterium 89]